MADDGSGATIRRMWLAGELKAWRIETGDTAERVAAELGWSHSKLSRIEGARAGVSATDAAALCRHYNVPADRAAAIDRVAREARQRTWYQRDYADVVLDWFGQYVGLEGSAVELQTFEGLVIPGLLQTREYAEAVTRASLVDAAEDEVSRKVAFRMERQAILERDDGKPHVWAILAEGVIRQEVGGRKVMKEQLDHLERLATGPDVTLQVLPYAAGAHAAMTGPFVIMRFPDPFPPVAYIDYLTSSAYLQEPPDVARYKLMFQHLIARALDTDRSLDCLREVRASM